jgi:hypothetical protein
MIFGAKRGVAAYLKELADLKKITYTLISTGTSPSQFCNSLKASFSLWTFRFLSLGLITRSAKPPLLETEKVFSHSLTSMILVDTSRQSYESQPKRKIE